MSNYDSARLHIETGGSIEAALCMSGEQILDALDEARENEGIIRVLRRQRDESESTLARVRKLADNDDLDWWVQDMILAAMAGES